MRKYSVDAHRVQHSIRLVVTLFVLLGFLFPNVDGSVYMSLLMEPYTTVMSPLVILQNGTAGTSTIHTNNTSAKVFSLPRRMYKSQIKKVKIAKGKRKSPNRVHSKLSEVET